MKKIIIASLLSIMPFSTFASTKSLEERAETYSQLNDVYEMGTVCRHYNKMYFDPYQNLRDLVKTLSYTYDIDSNLLMKVVQLNAQETIKKIDSDPVLKKMYVTELCPRISKLFVEND